MIKKPKRQLEYKLQVEVTSYIRKKYPDVLFLSDTVAAVLLTYPQAIRNRNIQHPTFRCPDLLIFESRRGFCGLFIELKVASPFKKDGVSLYSDQHLREQWASLELLQKKGYHASFQWEYDKIISLLDWYLRDD